jgi:hypothetical protein
MTFSDTDFLRFDPFEGDRDTDVKMRRVSIVKARRPHVCWLSLGPNAPLHHITPGSRARVESALVDGEWARYYVCLPCIEAWLVENNIEPFTLHR